MDEHGWDCFVQLAAGLKRAGFRTVRITLSPHRKAASRLCFDRTVSLGSAAELEHLPDILDGERIADVQVIESLSVPTVGGLARMPDNPKLPSWQARAAVVDKPYVAERLRAAEVAVPAIITGAVAGADEVIGSLGLPVVHKVRTGSGGDGVVVVETRQQLQDLLDAGKHDDSTFFETFIDGHHLQFAGVVTGPVDGLYVTYETLARKGYMGPASELRCLDDPMMAKVGLAVADALGIRGMINVNVIRDADGTDWVHDVNPRVWGSFISFRAAGFDFLGAYIDYLHGLHHVRERIGGYPDKTINVFPASFQMPLVGESRIATRLRFLRGAYPYLRWVGPRYVAHELGHELTRPK
ncbi:MAG: ATP-grasp domain-containing protein [Acidimicrobiales bacterium]